MPTVDNDSAAEFQRLAEVLATMPESIVALLGEHTPDGDGYCLRCGRPGYGTSLVQHPCPVAALAPTALAVRKRTVRS